MNFDLIGFLWFLFKTVGLIFLIYFMLNLVVQTIISNIYINKKSQLEIKWFETLQNKLENGDFDEYCKELFFEKESCENKEEL